MTFDQFIAAFIWLLSGTFAFYVLTLLSLAVRYLFCGCRKRNPERGEIELHSNEHFYGGWYGECRCGRRWISWRDFSRCTVEE